MSPDSVEELVAAARKGRSRAVGRLISMVENASPQLREVALALAPHTGNASVVGLTGAPGVGKSTMTSALVSALRERGDRGGGRGVDPSGPCPGGALLGDRVRMQEHATDEGVYIRSMATRGHLGGLAWATPQALRVLDGVGMDTILIETVGVGQSEVEIAGLADSTIVLLAPGMGDGIQAAKAGILEVGDVFVVNKADRDGAQQVVRDLRNALRLAGHDAGAWREPVISTVASQGEGLDEVAQALVDHRAWLASSRELDRRRMVRAREEIEAIGMTQVRARLRDVVGPAQLDKLADTVVAGDTDPYAAADQLLDALA